MATGYESFTDKQLKYAILSMEMTDHLGPQGIQRLRDAYNEVRRRREIKLKPKKVEHHDA